VDTSKLKQVKLPVYCIFYFISPLPFLPCLPPDLHVEWLQGKLFEETAQGNEVGQPQNADTVTGDI